MRNVAGYRPGTGDDRTCRLPGNELTVAKRLVCETAVTFGSHAPSLWLVDEQYFTTTFFSLICKDLQSHVLIRCKDPDFGDVLKDVDSLFEPASSLIDPISTEPGFDLQRCSSWTMEKTSGEFADVPVQVARLQEHFPKRSHNLDVLTYIMTTDLSLSCRENREAAHLRR